MLDTGLALIVDQFHELANRLRKAGVQFIIEPHLRFKGMPGEQYTMFLRIHQELNLSAVLGQVLLFKVMLIDNPYVHTCILAGDNLECKAMTNPQNLLQNIKLIRIVQHISTRNENENWYCTYKDRTTLTTQYQFAPLQF